MIKLIGRKRFTILVALAMVNVVLLAALMLWVIPSRDNAENQLNGLNGQIGTLQTDITTIKEQIQKTQEHMPYYDRLADIGFFDNQDRFEAERVIQNIQNTSGVRSASFSIGELVDINEPLAEQAGHRLVMSPVEVKNLQAFNDIEVYKLLYMINNNFSGHTRLKSLKLERPLVITQESLDALSDLERNIGFVTGTAEFEWYTMLEKPAEEVPGIEGAY